MMNRILRLPSFLTLLLALALLVGPALATTTASLPFATVFKGQERFDELKQQAIQKQWATLPIGDRIGAVGRAMIGTKYKNFTLEIDDHIEAPSVNLDGLDCWTFFETSLAFARMLDRPPSEWTPTTMLRFIELDRYRGGHCDGYLSRLHYLEDWLYDNQRRGLVKDLTRSLGGVAVRHSAVEMTVNWRSYRYLKNNPSLRRGIRAMEERVSDMPFYHVPESEVRSIESQLRTGDIICITTHDGRLIGTSHVGIAVRTDDGSLHFMHASAPWNYGRVVLDKRLSDYLYEFRDNAGIMVARPVK
ncbi:MAG: DUF1460 domain-containing protein [Chthoniobacteraceae bacterium]